MAVPVLAASICLAGCEEDLAAREHFEEPFSMYGVLSPQLPFQSILVYPIEDFPTVSFPDTANAAVTSMDLTTGETRTWQKTVVTDDVGRYSYAFSSPFVAEYGHTYRIEATRPSDGARSYAVVRVPPRATVQLVNPNDPNLNVLIEGEDIQVLTPEAEYVAMLPRGPILSYRFSYLPRLQRIGPDWQVVIHMGLDRLWVQTWYNIDTHSLTGSRCNEIVLREINLHIIVGDTVWNPPNGVFDFDVLSQAGVMENVQNGFGFVGGGYRIEERLRPTPEAVEEACFKYDPVLSQF